MLFRLNIQLNEDDYLAFNHFHSFESTHGKKLVQKSRNLFIIAMVVLAALFLLVIGLTKFSLIYATLLLLFTVLYAVFFKRILTRNLKVQIERLKKTGKLPFDPASTLEFSEDRMVEITASSRTEQNYSIIERVCIVNDRYILLYKSSVNAYILPIQQIREQVNQEDFIAFLSGKCANVEYY